METEAFLCTFAPIHSNVKGEPISFLLWKRIILNVTKPKVIFKK